MNDETDCRAAPATLGLLIIKWLIYQGGEGLLPIVLPRLVEGAVKYTGSV